ncbi:hypothetical protein ACO0LM_11980 [Undibacterium sp. Di26W]|uniref:hypothetical protein n=1 Tax=Undibacterium sp. Di26W TaxID=3413035 RepID=UPI003BF1F810
MRIPSLLHAALMGFVAPAYSQMRLMGSRAAEMLRTPDAKPTGQKRRSKIKTSTVPKQAAILTRRASTQYGSNLMAHFDRVGINWSSKPNRIKKVKARANSIWHASGHTLAG